MQSKYIFSIPFNLFQRLTSVAKAIKVLDKKTNETKHYNSINEAAQALNIRQTSISNYLNRNQIKAYKGRYIFTKVQRSKL